MAFDQYKQILAWMEIPLENAFKASGSCEITAKSVHKYSHLNSAESERMWKISALKPCSCTWRSESIPNRSLFTRLLDGRRANKDMLLHVSCCVSKYTPRFVHFFANEQVLVYLVCVLWETLHGRTLMHRKQLFGTTRCMKNLRAFQYGLRKASQVEYADEHLCLDDRDVPGPKIPEHEGPRTCT